MRNRIIVGVSGASGAPLAVEVLRQLKLQDVETHLICSCAAEMTIPQETGLTMEQFKRLADVVHDGDNLGAGPASGSFRALGMVVVPCSMKTVAGIASGYSDNLLLRAADVTLKERRRLVLAVRECPFSTIHLRNMRELSGMGAVILPAVLSFYNHPEGLRDCVSHLAGKILDQFGLEAEDYRRWEGMM